MDASHTRSGADWGHPTPTVQSSFPCHPPLRPNPRPVPTSQNARPESAQPRTPRSRSPNGQSHAQTRSEPRPSASGRPAHARTAAPARQRQPTPKPPKSSQKPLSLAASVSQALSSVSKRYSRKSTFVVARSPRRFRRHADAERSNALNPLVNALSALERVSNVKALFSGGHRNTHMSPSRRLCQVPLARRVGRGVRGEGRAWASPSRPSPRDCGGAARRANGVGAPFSLRQRGAAGGVGERFVTRYRSGEVSECRRASPIAGPNWDTKATLKTGGNAWESNPPPAAFATGQPF